MASNLRSPPRLEHLLLTPAEAAAYLGTTERHLRGLRERHGLRAVHLGGKVRFRIEDLVAFVNDRVTGW